MLEGEEAADDESQLLPDSNGADKTSTAASKSIQAYSSETETLSNRTLLFSNFILSLLLVAMITYHLTIQTDARTATTFKQTEINNNLSSIISTITTTTPTINTTCPITAPISSTSSATSFSPISSSFALPRTLPYSSSLPIVARTIYLTLCEGQKEAEPFYKSFPSIAADVLYYCWGGDCHHSFTPEWPQLSLLVSGWTSEGDDTIVNHQNQHQPFHRFTSRLSILNQPFDNSSANPDLWSIKSKVYIINESADGPKRVWSTSRNRMLERVQQIEAEQGWRYAYLTFMDGDVRVSCDNVHSIVHDSVYRSTQHAALRSKLVDWTTQTATVAPIILSQKEERNCFLAYDAFLLTAAPAIGTVTGYDSGLYAPNLVAQIGYHVDAILNSFHTEVLPYMMPYCSRYDSLNWWISQAYMVYRGECVFGHLLFLNIVKILRDLGVHREYPKNIEVFHQLDRAIESDKLFLLTRQDQQMDVIHAWCHDEPGRILPRRDVGPLLLDTYPGFSIKLLHPQCKYSYIENNNTCVIKQLPDNKRT